MVHRTLCRPVSTSPQVRCGAKNPQKTGRTAPCIALPPMFRPMTDLLPQTHGKDTIPTIPTDQQRCPSSDPRQSIQRIETYHTHHSHKPTYISLLRPTAKTTTASHKPPTCKHCPICRWSHPAHRNWPSQPSRRCTITLSPAQSVMQFIGFILNFSSSIHFYLDLIFLINFYFFVAFVFSLFRLSNQG